MGPVSALLFTLVAEVSDNITLKKGVNIEGMTYSCSSIGIKVGTGLGTSMVGWLLAAGHYNGKAATQAASALTMIKVSYLVIPVVVGILLVMCFLFMNVESENRRLRERD